MIEINSELIEIRSVVQIPPDAFSTERNDETDADSRPRPTSVKSRNRDDDESDNEEESTGKRNR